jgi:hypothetical protein
MEKQSFECWSVIVQDKRLLISHSIATQIWSKLNRFVLGLLLRLSCNKVVVKPISGCVRIACSQLLWQVWNRLPSPCYKVDDGNRPARNKLLRVCCRLFNNLLRAEYIRLCWPHQPRYKMITTCSRLINYWVQAARFFREYITHYLQFPVLRQQ